MAKDDDDAMVGIDDAATIGYRVVEKADRVKAMHAIVPGAVAKSKFEMDGVTYNLAVSIASDG